MRHRSSEPLVNLCRRLPRALAASVAVLAELDPLRALTVLVMTLGLGTSAFVAVASVSRPSTEAAGPTVLRERPVPSASRDSERPEVTHRPNGQPGSSEPGAPATRASRVPKSPDWLARSHPPTSGPSPTQQQKSRPSLGGASSAPSTPSPSSGGASTAPPDDIPPNTHVTTRFPDSDGAVFSFSADEPASYACSLDAAPYASCDSPSSVWGVHPGWHTFAVRATDAAGNVDPSPAEVRWHANAGSSTDSASRRP